MVAGLKFLSKKSFNPQNTSNQKTVWERQQERAQQEKRAQEREKQLQRERDDEELQRARGETPRLAFLYAAPPGLEGRPKEDSTKDDSSGSQDRGKHADPNAAPSSTNDDHGDKEESVSPNPSVAFDPAAAFREYLEAAKRRAAEKEAAATSEEKESDASKDESLRAAESKSFGTVLQGTSHDPVQAAMERPSSQSAGPSSALSALEKAVGRKHQHAVAGALSLEEQIQRFPALANAPRQKGITASHVGISFQPLGSQIRNVRCMACGIWGHSRGERECRVTGWNPFDAAGSTMSATAPPKVAPAGASSAGDADNDRKQPWQAENDHESEEEKRVRRGRRYDNESGTSRKGNQRGDSAADDESLLSGGSRRRSRDRDRNHHRRKSKKHKRSRSHKHKSRRRRRSESEDDSGTESDSRQRRKKHRKHREHET